MNQHTSDLSDEFFQELYAMCSRLECRPIDMASCWMSESGMNPKAHNPAGATGLFQVIPSTMKGLGFVGDWKAFQALSAVEQLKWAERYYGPHKGRLLTPSACYLATFMPSLLAHAKEPAFVICARNGPFAYAYAGNYTAFDPTGKGWITVQDLADRIEHVTRGPRWEEIAARIAVVTQEADTLPDATMVMDIGAPDTTSVKWQQCALSSLGFHCVPDGVWGPRSRAACINFQGCHPPLKCDGVCGAKTQAALKESLKAVG